MTPDSTDGDSTPTERPSATGAGPEGPDPLQRTVLIAGAGLLVALAVTVLVQLAVLSGRPVRPGVAFFLQLKLLVSTFNVVVLLALVSIYGRLYRELPNQFTLSLVLFSVALLLYAGTSNPIIHRLFGFPGGPGFSPFAVLPDVFASVAIVVLLYQSYK